MAFPTTGVIDAFTRADAASLGANYTANPFNNGATSLEIASNAAVGQNATFSFDLNWYNVATFGPDVEVFVTLSTLGDAASEVYLIARVQDPSASSSTGDGYWCELTGGGTTLTYKSITNGSASTLGSSETPGAFSPGDSFGFSVVGTTLQAYRKTSGVWSPYGTSRTDSTHSGAGYIGLGSYEDTRTQVIDDFGGGTAVYVPSERPVGNHPFSSSWLQRTEQFTGARDASAPMWAEWLFGTPVIGDITINAANNTITLNMGTHTPGVATTAATNTMTLSQAASALSMSVSTVALLMTLSQATPTRSASSTAAVGTMTLSQGAAAAVVSQQAANNTITLSQGSPTLSQALTAAVLTLTLSQGAATSSPSVSAANNTLTLSAAAPATANSAQAANNTMTLGQGTATPSAADQVTAANNTMTLSLPSPSLIASIEAGVASLMTLGQPNVSLDFGTLEVQADNNTITLSMGAHTVEVVSEGDGNKNWFILTRRRRL